MSKAVRSLTLSPEIAKFIRNNYPIVKKRTALWFFSNELRKNLTNEFNKPTVGLEVTVGRDNGTGGSSRQPGAPSATSQQQTARPDQSTPRINRIKMLNMWKKMDPESKRRYFNMAEFDELRYKEQKSQWISQVSSLLIRHHATVDTISESAPTFDELQQDFLASLDRLHKSYQQMIQYETTKELYKDAIRKVERYESNLSPQQFLSAVPKSQRSILERPRRPACAFILYVQDNTARLKAILARDKNLRKSTDTVMSVGAEEWSKLDRDTKRIYEEKYQQLKESYDKAMEEFREENLRADDNYIEQASKEKKAFRRSLRKRLRDMSVLPLSIRNAFNFFVMDHKDVPLPELTDIWRTLPLEKKLKYIKMNQDDVVRYQRERHTYNELTKTLEDIINRKSALGSDDDDDSDASDHQSVRT